MILHIIYIFFHIFLCKIFLCKILLQIFVAPQSPQRIYYHKYSWKVEEIMKIINEIDYKPQNYDELKKYVYITTQIISDYIQNNNTVKKKSSKVEKYQKKMV